LDRTRSKPLGEDPTKAQLIGVGAIVVGEIIVAITLDHSKHNGTAGGVFVVLLDCIAYNL
jgi:hypothetical protein